VGLRPLFILVKRRMNKLLIREKINEIAQIAADKNNLELVRAEVVGSEKEPIIRIFIDKSGGVTHEDCAAVSLEIGTVLDKENLISPDYTLEVSSPGLERELYSLKDFEKFTGSLAKVKTKSEIDGQRNFRGRIKNVEGEEIIFDDKTKGEVRFAYNLVAKANLEIDIEEEFKRGTKN
jgi:ribosome maturation factor RimP